MRPTDSHAPSARTLDTLESQDALRTLLTGQLAAIEALQSALITIEQGARAMAGAILGDGRLVYVAAGSSGLMALADAAELPGTFGIAPDRIVIHMAGGIPQSAEMPGDTEDHTADATGIADRLEENDVVIAVTASGTTPFPCRIAELARGKGVTVIGLHNRPGAKLGTLADIEICVPTGPEAIGGSTRLGAGTAQKAALNMMSSLMGVLLGHVHDGHMVNLRVDNAKLRDRAIGMVSAMTDTDADTAAAALTATGYAVKPAVLMALGLSRAEAERLLSENNQTLRPVLDARTTDNQSTIQGVSS